MATMKSVLATLRHDVRALATGRWEELRSPLLRRMGRPAPSPLEPSDQWLKRGVPSAEEYAALKETPEYRALQETTRRLDDDAER